MIDSSGALLPLINAYLAPILNKDARRGLVDIDSA